MLKNFAIFAAVVAVVTMTALSFITAKYIDQEEILRVEMEMEELEERRNQLLADVATMTEEQAQLKSTIADQTRQIEQHKARIAELEQERLANRLRVRGLRTEDDLEKSFAETFPDVIHADNFGITEFATSQPGITLPYFVIPAWYAGTFIENAEEVAKYEQIVEEFKTEEALYGSIVDLHEEVLSLEEQKSAAWQEGYNDAYAKYEALNKDYLSLLREPPTVEFKPPSLWASVGGLVLGIAVGAGIQ